jgi:hypothetical protein
MRKLRSIGRKEIPTTATAIVANVIDEYREHGTKKFRFKSTDGRVATLRIVTNLERISGGMQFTRPPYFVTRFLSRPGVRMRGIRKHSTLKRAAKWIVDNVV